MPTIDSFGCNKNWLEKYLNNILILFFQNNLKKYFIQLFVIFLANILYYITQEYIWYTTPTCFDSHNFLCLKTIDEVNSKFDLKNKEALHINWRKPKLIHNKIRQFSLFHYIFCPPFALFCRFFLFFFWVFFFVVSLWFIVVNIPDANYRNSLPS